MIKIICWINGLDWTGFFFLNELDWMQGNSIKIRSIDMSTYSD